MLQGLLDQEGLNHSPISIEGLTRQNVIVLEESSGRQFRFGMPGPTLHEAEWKRCLEVLETLAPKPDYLVGSGSLSPGVPDDFYARVARIATKRGIQLIVDTSGEALRLAARAGVYLLKPNMRELRALADHEIKDELEQERVVTEIIRKGGSELVVVSLGTAGALMASKEGCERLRAPTVPIQSKVGAGDSMVAGIVLSLAQGKSPRDAVRFGVAAGAAAAMTPGTELCRREDTERLYRHMVSENA
jgi:6-phosphofructokinase 2